MALVQGYSPYKTSGQAHFSFTSGNSEGGTASGVILVTAYGVAPVLPPAVIPLPAALPLFATALAGMGLLGWRRKRKTSA